MHFLSLYGDNAPLSVRVNRSANRWVNMRFGLINNKKQLLLLQSINTICNPRGISTIQNRNLWQTQSELRKARK